MPQEFQVLRCYSCRTFQVHPVKKAKKWNCKVCGEKQSLLKVFGQGTGAECRCHTQKLNMIQGDAHEQGTRQQKEGHEGGAQTLEDAVTQDDYDCMDPQRQESSSSRWCMYLDAEEVDGMNTNTGDDMYTTDWREYRASNKAARAEKSESKKQRKRLRTVDYSETDGSCEEAGSQVASAKRKATIENNACIPIRFPASEQLPDEFGVRSGMNSFPDVSKVHSLGETGINSEDTSADYLDKQVKKVPQMPGMGAAKKKNLRIPTVNNQQSKWGKFLAPDEGDSDSSEEHNANDIEDTNTFIHRSNIHGRADVQNGPEHGFDTHSSNQENSPPFETNGENETFAYNIKTGNRENRKEYLSAAGHIPLRVPPGNGSDSYYRTFNKAVVPGNLSSTLAVTGNPANNTASIFSLGETSDDDLSFDL